VSPPPAVSPDHHTEEYTFDRLGVRVPAVLVSPYMPNQPLNRIFDHTSLLKYLSDKWSLGPLGARTAAASSFGDVIGTALRADTVAVLPTAGPAQPRAQSAPQSRPTFSSNQTALFAMTQLLESATDVAGDSLKSRSQRLVTGFDGAVDVAMERVEDFLGQCRTLL
jgi:phospholipase C